MGNDDGRIKTLKLEHENYRLELNDYGCDDGEESSGGPYLTFEAEDESSTLSRDHADQVIAWLREWRRRVRTTSWTS